MVDLLADNVLLTLFAVIALGSAFGAIPFGPLRFGAAGALFVGLAVGAFVPVPADQLAVFQNLGLGLFVYLVGLEAGESFFKEFRHQFGLMLATVAAVVIAAVVAILVGGLLQLGRAVSVGVFAGALTATPALSLAREQASSDLPSVGYSIGYPVGVILAILLVGVVSGRKWPAKKDQVNPDNAVLQAALVEVQTPMSASEFREKVGEGVRLATVRRGARTTVVDDERDLRTGDFVSLFATKSTLPTAVEELGRRVPRLPFRDTQVALSRFTVSNRDIAESPVKDLPLLANYQSRITRIRRNDSDILVSGDTLIELGDIVEVALPARRHREVATYFGNSTRAVSELDTVAAAGGLSLGFLLGLLVIPLPGGASFALGVALGPLFVGMILGAVRTTGRISWQLPLSANYTLRQFGLLVFLAAVGIASGPAFVSTAFSLTGLAALVTAAAVLAAGGGALLLFSYLLGQSSARGTGAVSGLLGQPAVLQFALQRVSDNRISSGYTTTVAVALIAKIVMVPIMFAI